ncbi:MAG: trypsin-like peptidase domain-containing protein [Candidatus Omnitrophica bacterium]|nr:trypsin-like peptidase domain-containing protein [Candidatus Omnitrophota bacterium]
MKKKILFISIIFAGVAFCPQVYADKSSLEGFGMEDAVINVANTSGKAVVSISTEHIARIRDYGVYNNSFAGSPFSEDEFFRRFFSDFFGEVPEREFKQIGLGSGVIINPDGYILTNEHVVASADKIVVTLADGRAFKGEVKGTDSRLDLAVIKINARNLPFGLLGDSDALKVGQWAVAIGNPYAFAMENPEPTVSVGVISALHRSLGSALAQGRDYGNLIQTDAAINPGNSGGPLVSLRGEIVGINTAIFSTTGGYQGIGFAIPINNAKRIISQLIAGKRIAHGWLGMVVQGLNEQLVQYFGLADARGVLVIQVLQGSPAEACGLKAGDIIRQIDNIVISNAREFLNAIDRLEAGHRVKIIVIRNSQQSGLEAIVGIRPDEAEAAKPQQPKSAAGGSWRGMMVAQANEGVFVVRVVPGSPADAAGVSSGDLLLEINKQPVANLIDYKNAVTGLKGNCLVRTNRGYFLLRD